MNIGILLPGFSATDDDWAIPVYQHLVRALARDNTVRVIALRYPHHRQPYRIHGAIVHPLGAGAQARGRARLKLWWEAIGYLRRLHRQEPFHILHAMWADETGLIAGWVGRLLNIPTVVSVAGGELAQLRELNYGGQNSAFGRWVVGQALHSADAVVVACRYARQLIHTRGYRPRHIICIPLGIDEAIFQPKPIVKRSNHLIHVGSLIGVKDQKTLLKALAQLPHVTADIVGDGPLRPTLEAQAQALGIANRVHFVGSVHHLALADYYSRARLHVLTSLHEGQGMVTLEAGACGLPSISTDVGLLPDYPTLGFVIPRENPTALAQAIHSLLIDEQRLLDFGLSAQAFVRSHLTITHTASALQALYEALIASR